MPEQHLSPIHLYVERDGPNREGRTGRGANTSMDIDLHVIVAGRSEKVMTAVACFDAATNRTTLRVSVGKTTVTETYDSLEHGARK